MSVYQHVNGAFDYIKMPLAPLGCAVQMHESTNRWRTRDPHSLSRWYLGTSPKHYQCHQISCQMTQSKRILDMVFFQHRYITRPVTTPDDQIIKAVGDLKSALWQRINAKGGEDMEVLQKLNDSLNNVKSSEVAVKKVTFSESIHEPRVSGCRGDMQQSPRRVLTSRVTTGIINKPLMTTATKGLIVAKPPATATNNGLITQSKYAQALADIVCRRWATPSSQFSMIELAQAVLGDDLSITPEQAFEVFDSDTGKLLKYWQLITHPKYHEVWMHSSANEFERLTQGVGGQIQGTNTVFFIHKHQVPANRWRDITYA